MSSVFEKIRPKAAFTPKLDETYVMASNPRLIQASSPQSDEVGGESLSDRARVPSIIVLKGRTAQKKYALLSKLTCNWQVFVDDPAIEGMVCAASCCSNR